ncbi:MAG: transglycosylase domain-containing protein, partial [Solirubrobacteraceae bacterium]
MLGSVVAVCAIVLSALGLVGYVMAVAAQAPNIDQLQPRIQGQESEIYTGSGQLLGYMGSDVLRTALHRDQQGKLLREATVAIEDRRFWQHGGVDYEGLLRAAIKDVLEGGGIQGGSTLTMQLVTNEYLPKRYGEVHNLRYKIIQAKLANELESQHTKSWILTQYLNDVPYGTENAQHAYGVAAAAQMFFDKPVRDLKLPQIALLAGLPQAPSEYNPFNDPSLARWRRGLVLAAMVESGYITQRAASAADAAPLGVVPNDAYGQISQPYVVSYVEQQLAQDLPDRVLNKGGLKVYTTINLADQEYAKQAIAANQGHPGDPAAALVTIDPHNGDILALQNSTTYGTGTGQTEFDYATQAARQTGSAFKPFVMMTLIHDDNGNPNETFYDSHYLAAGWLPGYPHYSVQTAEETYQGVISVTKAMTVSDNTIFAQLGVDLGMTNVDAMAHAMGITSQLTGNPAEAIGGLKYGVSPLQMADAYVTMADGGNHIPPTIVSKVVLPSGQVLNLGDPAKARVFSPGQAYAATQVLKTVIQDGTGTAANYGCPAAGKTGTTSNYTDAWFVGYTPALSTAVWVGYPNATTSMTDVNGLGPGYGGTLAAPIWHAFMQRASGGFCGDFHTPNQYWDGQPYFGPHSSTQPIQVIPTTETTSTTGTTGAGGLGGGTATQTTTPPAGGQASTP